MAGSARLPVLPAECGIVEGAFSGAAAGEGERIAEIRPHDPSAARVAHRTLPLADGRVVGDVHAPR